MDRETLRRLARKGLDAALREVAQAPEQRSARAIARQTIDGPSIGRRVAFLTPRSWAVHVHLEGLLGHELRRRGVDLVYLTCGGDLELCDRVNTWEGPPPPCRTCRAYTEDSIDAHGHRRARFTERTRSAEWPEIDEMGLDELMGVTYRDVELGALLAVPTTWFLMTSDLHNDPLARLTIRRFLRTGRHLVDRLHAELTRLDPDTLVVLNGRFFFESIASTVARNLGIDVVTYERGFITQTWVFRRQLPASLYDISYAFDGTSPATLPPEQEAQLDEYLADRRRGARSIVQYWPEVSDDVNPVDQKLAVLFSNITWDSAVVGREVAFDSLRSWLRATVEAFRRRDDWHLVIRVHPAEVRLPGKTTREPVEAFVRTEYPEIPANVSIIGADDPTSSYALIDAASVCLVLSSTIGLEIAATGTPVIVAGETHYRGKGFTIDADNPEHYERLIDDVTADPAAYVPDVGLARRYTHCFFFDVPITIESLDEPIAGLTRIDHDALIRAPDPGVSAICDGILDPGAFGGPPPT